MRHVHISAYSYRPARVLCFSFALYIFFFVVAMLISLSYAVITCKW